MSTQAPRERFLTALHGQLPNIQPVAPLYLNLYLAGLRHAAQARLWRERAARSGGRFEVTYEEYLAVERAVWWEGYQLFSELPDWLAVPIVASRPNVEGSWIELTPAGCLWHNPTGQCIHLEAPFTDNAAPLWEIDNPPRTVADVEALIPLTTAQTFIEAGTYALATQLTEQIGDEYALYCSLSAPYPAAYRMLGFSGLMVALKEAPDMVTAIAERQLTNSLAAATAAREAGLGIVFVEEWACSADLISPQDYLTFAWPFERDLCAGLERLGFSTVFYFCGPLQDRLEHLCCLAAEALAFEESKKGWTIDLQQVRSQVGEQRCLFGNLDVRKVRDLSPMALQAEVHDMIEKVGPSAFITSIGSPLTLDTPPTKVNALIQAARCYSGPMG